MTRFIARRVTGMAAVLFAISVIVFLIFNVIPFYPLDGGQIVQSILWFFIGLARSLFVSTIIGLIGALGFAAIALFVFAHGARAATPAVHHSSPSVAAHAVAR